MGPITPREEFSLETRPFLTVVFEVLNCSENDYLVLFSLSLLRAIQKNEGGEIEIYVKLNQFRFLLLFTYLATQ